MGAELFIIGIPVAMIVACIVIGIALVIDSFRN